MNRLMQDMRYALRQLRKAPGFTLAVMLTLALGIGLNTAIFTMVDCVLLRPLGYRDANRIYALNTRFTKDGRSSPRLGGGDYVDFAHSVKSFESAAYYAGPFKDGIQLEDRAVYTDVTGASSRLLSLMGVQPVAGRLISDEDTENDVVLSSGFASSNFGSAAEAVGKPVSFDGKPRLVVGVLPEGFSFPGKTSVWIGMPAEPEIMNRTAYNQQAVAKVRPGVSAAQFSAELAAFSRQLGAAYPEDKDKALVAVPLQEEIVGKIRPLLRLLMASVLVVLLIVCANVTHLQLVRATRQRREISIRTALGATRSEMAWRALLEAGVLAAGGCAAGILIAEAALRLIVSMAPQDIPRLADVRLNGQVALFSLVLSVLMMAAAALLPVLRSWRSDPVSALRQDASCGHESGAASRLRDALVVAEVALTLLLSVAAVLLMRQMRAEAKVDLGFAADNLLLMDVHAPAGANKTPQQGVSRLGSELEVVEATPGVERAAAVSGAPTGTTSDVLYAIHGRTEFVTGADLKDADIVPITAGYFAVMHIPLLRGRLLEASDTATGDYVAVITRAMAAQSFSGQDPIGKEIMCGYDEQTRWIRIVGVVDDVRQDSPASAPYPTFYVPVAQHPRIAGDMQLVVRTAMAPAAMLRTVQSRLEHFDPTLALGATTMRESIGESERLQHFRTLLFGSFAALSVLLAAIGMYGLMAYAVAQRRFEFALRFALGASRGRVTRMVLLKGLRVASIGLLAGVALSVLLMRLMSTLLGKVAGVDVWAFGLAAMEVLLIVLVATLVPAFKAASVEPMEALRTE